ncbi:family 20 glycosylhydrolase [Actinomycetaceae bacterium MB13-C1-2]|nr:family 20 glycosylhydrolase [Actinomycetaceae bacterium MB13-C1-2]
MSISNLVPLPKSFKSINGPYFRADTAAVNGADELAAMIERAKLAIAGPGTPGSGTGMIELTVDPEFYSVYPDLTDSMGKPTEEAYRISVGENLVQLSAPSTKGLARAIATLTQLVETNRDGSLGIPQCVVEDAPRYSWRGISMDVSRSFYTIDEMKTLVDLLAFYRMNTLHLHLSDDQGWRLEVPSLPRLTEISGMTAGEGGRSGFYSTEQFADLVQYASDHGVTVIPEFDVPGHTNAATHAYGELMPDGEPTDAYAGTKVGFSKLYPGVPFTKEFMIDVFEVAALAGNGEYVHIGGDEALEQSAEDYKLLVEQAAAAVAQTGKKVVGWQESGGAELPPDSVVQYWNSNVDPAPVLDAVANGHGVLMSPAPHAYFDMMYNESTPYGQDWAGLIELPKSYLWDPAKQLAGVDEEHIVGVEAGMWTERIRTLDELMYMLLPRIPALAEVGWTAQESRDWDDFRSRIADHPEYWDSAELRWHRSPEVDWKH